MQLLLITFLQDRNTLSDVYSLGCVYFEMLTLLKGESIPSMRQFFSDNGMKSMILRTNLVVANLWLDKLLAKHTDDYDNEPITWIRSMIERSPEHRPSSEELAHWTIGTANVSRFCCPSCMDEDEMSSQDESLPPQLRQSPMELERSDSETSTQDITNIVDEFSTRPHATGTIAQPTQNSNGRQSQGLSGRSEGPVSIIGESYNGSRAVKSPSTMPKLDRAMTDAYADELYNPSFHITSALPSSTPAPTMVLSPQNDVFSQRLQAANSQHQNALKYQAPTIAYSSSAMNGGSPDHSRKSSVTISANVPSSMNSGPVGGSKGNIQFGSITDSPVASHSTPQISQPTASAPIERTTIQISTNPKAPLLQKLPENHSTIVERDQLSSSSKRSAITKKQYVEKMTKEPTREDNKASSTTEFARSVKVSEHNTPVPANIPSSMSKGLAVQQSSASTSVNDSKAVLSPGPWTEAEDRQLLKLKSLDKTWSQIAEVIAQHSFGTMSMLLINPVKVFSRPNEIKHQKALAGHTSDSR
jgi:hypothetical protein